MKELRILLVEDNPDDLEIIRRTVDASDAPLSVEVATTGEDALALLRSASALPGLIFLDISLPGADGLEILRRLKSDPLLGEIPVIMLSGSENDDDVRTGGELGAHSHFVKPLSAHDLSWVTTAISRYWERIDALTQT